MPTYRRKATRQGRGKKSTLQDHTVRDRHFGEQDNSSLDQNMPYQTPSRRAPHRAQRNLTNERFIASASNPKHPGSPSRSQSGIASGMHSGIDERRQAPDTAHQLRSSQYLAQLRAQRDAKLAEQESLTAQKHTAAAQKHTAAAQKHAPHDARHLQQAQDRRKTPAKHPANRTRVSKHTSFGSSQMNTNPSNAKRPNQAGAEQLTNTIWTKSHTNQSNKRPSSDRVSQKRRKQGSFDEPGRKREGFSRNGSATYPFQNATADSRAASKLPIWKHPFLIACLAVVLLGAIGWGVDSLINGNKIYSGVSIGDVDVSGMTREQATDAVSSYYSPRVSGNVATFYATQDDENNPEQAKNAENIAEQISYEESLDQRRQWTLPSDYLDAALNVDDLVDQAFEVGRNNGGIAVRIQAATHPWQIAPQCTFNDTTLSELLDEMTAVVGEKRVNYDIEIKDGIASITDGYDGREVTRDWLVDNLNSTYLGTETKQSYVLQTEYMPLQIAEDAARVCADTVNASLAHGAHFTFEDQSWDASRDDMASWVHTRIDEVNDSYALNLYFDEQATTTALLGALHSNINEEDLHLSFDKDDKGAITVSTNATGTVPEAKAAVDQMNQSFFVTESRTEAPTIALESTDLPSQMSFNDARDFGIVTAVSSFTTQYSSGAEARTHNIHTAADLLSNSIAKANGGSWSFNDTAGEATEDKGYQDAGAIVGGEYSDAIGGGICQVATTVFNAIYDAGYPISERHNHTLRISSYPEGRDAAIAYPYMDLVWENDTSSDVLLVMTYTNSSVTATLWGVDPHYQVSTKYGEWKKGEPYSVTYKNDNTVAAGKEYVETTGVNGSSISIVRTVKDAGGNILHQDLFESNYEPKNEVIVKGTRS